MAVNLSDVGIQSHSGTLIESVEYTTSMDEAVVTDSDSSFGAGEAFDPTTEWEINGRGDILTGLTLGSDGGLNADITGVNDGLGKSIVTNVRKGWKNDDIQSWSCAGSYFPGVT